MVKSIYGEIPETSAAPATRAPVLQPGELGRLNPWWVTMRIGITLFCLGDLWFGYLLFSGGYAAASAAGTPGFIGANMGLALAMFVFSCAASDGLPRRRVP